jgi:hypothetical protein
MLYSIATLGDGDGQSWYKLFNIPHDADTDDNDINYTGAVVDEGNRKFNH